LPGRDLSACGHAQAEKEYCFCKQEKITPLLQKTIQEIEKRKEKHNTQKIIKISGKEKLNYFYRVMLKRRRTLKRYIRRENHPLLHIFILIQNVQ